MKMEPTQKADAIEHRIKDKCEERADEWADDVLGRLICLTHRRALSHRSLCPILQRALSSR